MYFAIFSIYSCMALPRYWRTGDGCRAISGAVVYRNVGEPHVSANTPSRTYYVDYELNGMNGHTESCASLLNCDSSKSCDRITAWCNAQMGCHFFISFHNGAG